MTSVTISHDRCAARFTASLDGKTVGELTYVIGNDVMNINHTFVEPDLRGRGIGTKLIEEAKSFARSEGLKVVATCSYAASNLGQ